MKRLDINISTNGHKYTLLRRSENVALYKQFDKNGLLVGYELFKIQIRPEETIKGVTYLSREVFASNEQFGTSAWSPPISKGENYAVERFEEYDKEILSKLTKKSDD